jgi:hypothetical protein
MEKSTLVEILRTFTKEELAAFSDFSASPYFNKKSNVTKLFESLKKFAPLYPPEKISKEEIWKKVFPGKKYNYGIMKNLIFDLNKLAVKFLELEISDGKTLENDLSLLEAYRRKNLKSLFMKKLAESKKSLNQRPLDNKTHYYQYMLSLSPISFLDYEHMYREGEKDFHSEINESLILYYCTNQLYYNTNSLQYAVNSSSKYDKKLHEKTLEFYDSTAYKDPYTDTLRLCYIAHANHSNEEAYFELKKSFLENFHKFSKAVQYNLAVSLINFCRNNAQRGNDRFIKEEFAYIKLCAEEKLYPHGTFLYMDQYMFMHSVMIACRAGEYGWAEAFIEDHRHELLESVREQYVNYAYVTLNLRRGKFEDALRYLSQIKNVDKADKLNIKVFEFNAYYELNYYNELKALADSTFHMLKTDKLFQKEEKENFKAYVKATTWLMEYKCGSPKNQGNPELLKSTEEFVKAGSMRNKLWLIRKIEELKK